MNEKESDPLTHLDIFKHFRYKKVEKRKMRKSYQNGKTELLVFNGKKNDISFKRQIYYAATSTKWS